MSKSAFAVTAVLVVALAACADSADVPEDETTSADASTSPPETKLPPAQPATATETEKKCVPTCNTDSDCASSCPALAGGVQCCDLKSKTCWGSKTSSCPAPVDAGTEPTPTY